MVDCAPSKLLSEIHYRLPLLSHVRFGGDFTDDSLSETLPGEIDHVGGWAGILLTVSLLLIAFFYVLCCYLCVCCKRIGKCTACQTQNAQQLLRCMSGTLAILSVVLVLLTFWPEVRMHNGISSFEFSDIETDDAQEMLLEIAEDVVDSALLSIEQLRHRLVICYLVFLLLPMIVAVFILFFAQRCTHRTGGAGVFIVMIVLAGVTTAVHIPLVVFLFAVVVMYADVCISIYSTEGGILCTNMQQNMSVNTNSHMINVFCNQTVYHGFILIMITLSLAALLILIQLFGFCYGLLLCCIKEDDNEEIGTIANDNIISSNWTPQRHFIGLTPVNRSSREWVQIKDRVHHTLKEANIINIQQIHNKWLWDVYAQSRLRLSAKNGGITNVNEMLLFHGSRLTRPEQVYNSEKGFDFHQGHLGEGTYFAVDAQYSDRYAYEPYSGRRQFFLAMVLTGESYSCGEDRSLKKPPLKERNTMFTDERYDSVHGKIGGSDIYVVYEHDKAYPVYLITYSLHSQR